MTCLRPMPPRRAVVDDRQPRSSRESEPIHAAVVRGPAPSMMVASRSALYSREQSHL
jgi:hypothetical protein